MTSKIGGRPSEVSGKKLVADLLPKWRKRDFVADARVALGLGKSAKLTPDREREALLLLLKGHDRGEFNGTTTQEQLSRLVRHGQKDAVESLETEASVASDLIEDISEVISEVHPDLAEAFKEASTRLSRDAAILKESVEAAEKRQQELVPKSEAFHHNIRDFVELAIPKLLHVDPNSPIGRLAAWYRDHDGTKYSYGSSILSWLLGAAEEACLIDYDADECWPAVDQETVIVAHVREISKWASEFDKATDKEALLEDRDDMDVRRDFDLLMLREVLDVSGVLSKNCRATIVKAANRAWGRIRYYLACEHPRAIEDLLSCLAEHKCRPSYLQRDIERFLGRHKDPDSGDSRTMNIFGAGTVHTATHSEDERDTEIESLHDWPAKSIARERSFVEIPAAEPREDEKFGFIGKVVALGLMGLLLFGMISCIVNTDDRGSSGSSSSYSGNGQDELSRRLGEAAGQLYDRCTATPSGPGCEERGF